MLKRKLLITLALSILCLMACEKYFNNPLMPEDISSIESSTIQDNKYNCQSDINIKKKAVDTKYRTRNSWSRLIKVSIEYLKPFSYTADHYPIYLIGRPFFYKVTIGNSGHTSRFKNLTVRITHEYFDSKVIEALPGNSKTEVYSVTIAPKRKVTFDLSFLPEIPNRSSYCRTHVEIFFEPGSSEKNNLNANKNNKFEDTKYKFFDDPQAGIFYIKSGRIREIEKIEEKAKDESRPLAPLPEEEKQPVREEKLKANDTVIEEKAEEKSDPSAPLPEEEKQPAQEEKRKANL